MSSNPINIKIFGKYLNVNCPANKENELKNAADYLNKKIKELKSQTNVTNLDQLIIITALNVCYELSQEKIKTKDYILNMENKIRIFQKNFEKKQ